MKEHLEDSLLECTMQDLLRYDDYNNDGHLSLHEFYTAFRKYFSILFFPLQNTVNLLKYVRIILTYSIS